MSLKSKHIGGGSGNGGGQAFDGAVGERKLAVVELERVGRDEVGPAAVLRVGCGEAGCDARFALERAVVIAE